MFNIRLCLLKYIIFKKIYYDQVHLFESYTILNKMKIEGKL